MGVLEGTSLADPSEIKKKTKGMLGFEIKNNSPLDAALGEYAKACHVRHAIAHAGGIISARNIIALGVVAPPKSPQRVQVTVTAIQDVAAICETVVRSYNQYAFESILGNWLGKSLLVGDWRFDQELVKPLFRLFYSSQDGLTPKTAYGLWRRLPRIH
ncbi:hypothetical protein ACIBMZ_28510 [Micromonospora sp. NPDC049900]|uniref:hypothetical protein n=1 Tax=Micromonospora sp. NPDC049900 TaxID=3364275 RepID=UPI0037B27CF6